MTCKVNPLHTLFLDNYCKSCQLITPFDFSHCTFFPQRLLPMPSIKQPKWTPTSRWKKSRYEWKITPVIPKKDSWQLLPYYHCLFFIFFANSWQSLLWIDSSISLWFFLFTVNTKTSKNVLPNISHLLPCYLNLICTYTWLKYWFISSHAKKNNLLLLRSSSFAFFVSESRKKIWFRISNHDHTQASNLDSKLWICLSNHDHIQVGYLNLFAS